MINVSMGQPSPESCSMMDKMLLGVLWISEWFILSTCLPRQYHYVGQNLNWTEAQTYCRQTYTDLATVTNAEEMAQIRNMTPSPYPEAWIGLYSEIDWKWSDGFKGNGYRNWDPSSSQPDFRSASQLCVCIGDGGEWWDDYYFERYPFICYRGTQMDPEFVLVNERKTWSDAQRYCRENFIDLATIKNHTENQRVRSLVPNGDWAWIGLTRDPNFYWSDQTSFSYSYWDAVANRIGSLKVICGVTDQDRSGRWRFLSCDSRKPFSCQSLPPPATIRKQVIKLKLSLLDSSLNLENQTVKEKLLKKFQEKLEANGVTGVTLKWKERADGKVYHKEGGSSQKNDRKKGEL